MTAQIELPQFIREVVRQWMQNEMSNISEETIFAGWECGLEFRLWRAVQALPKPHEYCGTVIDAGRKHQHGIFTAWVMTKWRDREIDFWNLAKGSGRVSKDCETLPNGLENGWCGEILTALYQCR